MDTDAPSLFWFLVPGVVLPAVLLVLAFRSPTTRQVRRWAAGCDVTITAANEDLVRSHLGRVRRCRSVAAFPFWWMATVPLVVGTRFPAEFASPTPALMAYVAGALVGEFTVRSVVTGPVKQASLSPRDLQDYRPEWISALPWVLIVIATAIVALPFGGDDRQGRAGAVVTVAVSIGLVAGSRLVARRIVERPQRSGDADVLAADDGLRATAVALTAAIAVLAGLASVSAATRSVTETPTGWWAAISFVVLIGCSVLSMAMVASIVRQETWGYRRRHRQAVLDLS